MNKSDEKYKEVIDCFRKATYALSPTRYEEGLQEMVYLGRPWVVEYCRNIPMEKWSSAFFLGCRFGKTSSSVSESFNNWISDDKKLPACSLVDTIKLRIMKMMSERHKESSLMNPELLTPAYQALLELHIQMGRPWRVTQSDNHLFKVHSPRWRVYGFPCSHATAAIAATGSRFLDYIDNYFKVSSFHELYSLAIRPVPNYDRPDEYTEEDIILPPTVIRDPKEEKRRIASRAHGKREKIPLHVQIVVLKTHHNKATCNIIRQYLYQ
ncbi:uncharacterized protein LOC113305725 [Papaver somniferum]|uniref:uncharacterized protein LOC113305725 n=1 Tax=Papaver somniferum TaxID=3469 RepID=UPI000E6FC7F3|nr:uncharacterized protein LOC113305725 [Papaver somniferum]